MTVQVCIDCGISYDEAKGEYHPPELCCDRNPKLKVSKVSIRERRGDGMFEVRQEERQPAKTGKKSGGE